MLSRPKAHTNTIQKIAKKLLLLLCLLFLMISGIVIYLFETAEDGIPILNYHQINDTANNALTLTTEQFAAQMDYLDENGYTTITPTEMLDAWEKGIELPEKPIIITFDDGYIDNYENAYPILKEHGFSASIFIVTDFIETYPNYLTWAQVKEMDESGLISIEGHTLSHVDLTAGTLDEAEQQLKLSKEAIDWRTRKPVTFVAYPCGAYNDEILALSKELGYRGGFTVNYGLASPGDPQYLLNRIPIFGGNNHNLLRFKLRLSCAPILHPLNNLRESLQKDGHTFLSSLILIP